MNRLPDDYYTRSRQGAQFYKEYFLRSYKELLDVSTFKEDKDGFIKLMNNVRDKLKNVNYDENVLFICKDNINKEVFLNGFFGMSEINTYFYGNIVKIYDIYHGNMRDSNPNIQEEDIVYSEQCIEQDVMCVYIDKDMYTVRTFDKILNSVIVSRGEKLSRKGKRLKSWIFFKGTYSDLENSETLSGILRLFKSEDGRGYTIVDMNNMGVSVAINTKDGKSKVQSTSKNSLSDIY